MIQFIYLRREHIKKLILSLWYRDIGYDDDYVARGIVAKIVGFKLLGLISKDSNYPYHGNGEFSHLKFTATPHPSNSTYEKDWISFYNTNLSNTQYIKKNRPVDLANFILNKLE